MVTEAGSLAVVTGASSGIGYQLAKCCAKNGFDLLIAADEPAINDAAADCRGFGVAVEAVEVDLATIEGSPTPAVAWEEASSTRISIRCGVWSIPTSRVPFI